MSVAIPSSEMTLTSKGVRPCRALSEHVLLHIAVRLRNIDKARVVARAMVQVEEQTFPRHWWVIETTWYPFNEYIKCGSRLG